MIACSFARYCNDSPSIVRVGVHHLCPTHLANRLTRRPNSVIDFFYTGRSLVYLLHFDRPLSGHAQHYPMTLDYDLD